MVFNNGLWKGQTLGVYAWAGNVQGWGEERWYVPKTILVPGDFFFFFKE